MVLMTGAWLRDDIHPDDWLLYEFSNIALNLYSDFKAKAAKDTAMVSYAAQQVRNWFSSPQGVT